MKQDIRKKGLIIVLIFWMIFIFNMSSRNAVQSSDLSGGFINIVLEVISKDFRELDEASKMQIVSKLQFIVRKAAHFSIYAILGILLFLVLEHLTSDSARSILNAITISFLYALSDETHQAFVPGRSGEIRDIIIDTLGAICGVILIILFREIFHEYKKGKELKLSGKEILKQ